MRKLIIISNILYIRNYIETGAFKNIIDDDTYFACIKNIKGIEKLRMLANFAGEIEVTKNNERLYGFVTKVLMHANRNVNKGFYLYFKIRFTAIYFQSLRLRKKVVNSGLNRFWQSVVIRVLEFIRPIVETKKLLEFIIILIINYLGLTNFVVKLFSSFLPLNKDILSIVNEVKPDLVLMPNGALDPLANDVFCIAHRVRSFKTMLLIDNWDNLCSKSKFPLEPDYLCVWGRQAKSHAKNFHGIDSSRVFLAGSPRFDVYYDFMNGSSECENPINSPYILFAGCWPAFDEIGVLEKINDLLIKYKSILPVNCKVLYRPHPWGENYDKLEILKEKNLVNIVVDPQILYSRRPDDCVKRTDFQPSLNYYPCLLDSAEFVICPLSSMLIEASILNKKTLVLAHDDGQSLLNPAMMYENSDYFDRFSDMTNLSLLHNLNDLDDMFYHMITNEMPISKDALSYYIVDNSELYPKRIEKIINQLEIN